jgi:hypothetical protein
MSVHVELKVTSLRMKGTDWCNSVGGTNDTSQGPYWIWLLQDSLDIKQYAIVGSTNDKSQSNQRKEYW